MAAQMLILPMIASTFKGGGINGDKRWVGVFGSDDCEMIVNFGDLRGFL